MKKIYVFLFMLLVGCENSSNTSLKECLNPTNYVDVGDCKIFYQKFGAGEPIFVLHGGPGLGHGYLLPQMLELAKDRELIFYDQRGSGNSSNTQFDAAHINIKKFVADLDNLRAKLGYQKITLFGHSWGVKLAMHYAIKHPENVSCMILVSPACMDKIGEQLFVAELNKRLIASKINSESVLYDSIAQQTESQIEKSLRNFLSVYFYNPKDAKYLNIHMKKKAALNRLIVMRVMISTYPSDAISLRKFHKSLSELKIPTLIIYGKQDVIPMQEPEKIKSHIPNSKAVYLDECGHFPYIEKPTETFSEIRKFLTNLER
jgi:proline iminopeptidase